MSDIFVAGIDRECGKTLIGSGLCAVMQSLGYSTLLYKPIQLNAKELNGFKTSADISYIQNIDSNIMARTTYLLSGKNSPFVELYSNNTKFNMKNILEDYENFSKTVDCKIVEGSNSITTPIDEEILEIDILRCLNLPLVLVINPLQTPVDRAITYITLLKKVNINILGVIYNKYNEESEDLEIKCYHQILEKFVNVEKLGFLPDYKDKTPNAKTLIADILNNINIEKVFGLNIEKLHD